MVHTLWRRALELLQRLRLGRRRRRQAGDPVQSSLLRSREGLADPKRFDDLALHKGVALALLARDGRCSPFSYKGLGGRTI